MNVVIKKVDNPKAKHREGSIRNLELYGNRAFFHYVDDSGLYTITSPIKSIVIQTLNTKYECEVIGGNDE